jgi:hypothetical protein
MRKRTPEQEARDAERVRAISTPAPPEASAATTATSFAIMRGRGADIEIGGKTYNLAPYTTKHREAGYNALRKCPAILIAEAASGDDDKPVSLELLAYNFNRLTGRTDPEAEDPIQRPLTIMEVFATLAQFPETITEEQVDALYEPVLIALRRHHPDVTKADLEDDFDIGTFVRLVRAIDRANTGLLRNF